MVIKPSLLALQLVTLAVLAISAVATWNAVRVWLSLRGKPGGQLALVLAVALATYTAVNFLVALNVLNLMIGNDSGEHSTIRLVEQTIMAVFAIWAIIKLRRMG